jgi:hypothetical protein
MDVQRSSLNGASSSAKRQLSNVSDAIANETGKDGAISSLLTGKNEGHGRTQDIYTRAMEGFRTSIHVEVVVHSNRCEQCVDVSVQRRQFQGPSLLMTNRRLGARHRTSLAIQVLHLT